MTFSYWVTLKLKSWCSRTAVDSSVLTDSMKACSDQIRSSTKERRKPVNFSSHFRAQFTKVTCPMQEATGSYKAVEVLLAFTGWASIFNQWISVGVFFSESSWMRWPHHADITLKTQKLNVKKSMWSPVYSWFEVQLQPLYIYQDVSIIHMLPYILPHIFPMSKTGSCLRYSKRATSFSKRSKGGMGGPRSTLIRCMISRKDMPPSENFTNSCGLSNRNRSKVFSTWVKVWGWKKGEMKGRTK